MKVTDDIFYIGVNDHNLDMFEGQYVVPNGIAYNSYVIIDDKIAVMDTIEKNFIHEWLDNLKKVLNGKSPDFLVVQHMEPDHSANIVNFMKNYPNAKIVSSTKSFAMMKNYFGTEFEDRRIIVGEGDILSLGKHELIFISAPMVHWPEVIVTYDKFSKVLFSADAFGKFGALDVQDNWIDEARRYYFGIVGKYGAQVQLLLKKVLTLEIEKICSLHGPILTENLDYYIGAYDTWSSYKVETDGIVVAYTSIYGNTKKAVEILVNKFKEKGCKNIVVHDLARCDMKQAVADAFRYGKIVFATTTYNMNIFPYMREFINHLTERNFCNRTVAFIENGSWAPQALNIMKSMLANSKNLTFTENNVRIMSAINDENKLQIEKLSDELCKDFLQNSEVKHKNDLSALFKIGYGLYVVTSNDGQKDNGLIVNTITQVTNSPNRIAVCINKESYSHHIIKQTGIMNVNCLSVDTPFSIFENFGFKSGRNTNKFEKIDFTRSDNGLAFLTQYINSFMSVKVEQYVDLDTHGMFICTITEARVISNKETMTYNYYQANVKPKPKTEGKKGWICKICGYIHEDDELPDDFVCPICKHGVADFEKIK